MIFYFRLCFSRNWFFMRNSDFFQRRRKIASASCMHPFAILLSPLKLLGGMFFGGYEAPYVKMRGTSFRISKGFEFVLFCWRTYWTSRTNFDSPYTYTYVTQFRNSSWHVFVFLSKLKNRKRRREKACLSPNNEKGRRKSDSIAALQERTKHTSFKPGHVGFLLWI